MIFRLQVGSVVDEQMTGRYAGRTRDHTAGESYSNRSQLGTAISKINTYRIYHSTRWSYSLGLHRADIILSSILSETSDSDCSSLQIDGIQRYDCI